MISQDRDFFDSLYRKNVPQLMKTVNGIVNNIGIAEEIVNEAFLILLQQFEDVKNHENPSGWLFVVVRRLAFNEIRKASNNEVSLDEIQDVGEDDKALISFQDSLPAKLSEEEKTLLVLRYEKQMNTREIAQHLGISESSCRTKLHRAKQRYAYLRKREQEKFGF